MRGGRKGMHTAASKAKIAEAMRTRIVSPETRAKMAAAKRAASPAPGHRAKLAAALKGRPKSAETRARMSAAKKGVKFTEAHKAKMREVWDRTHAPVLGMGRGKRTLYKGIWFRSTYEARFAQVLDRIGVVWLYEPRRFDLGDGFTYLPDFWVEDWQLWVETKGFMRDDDREKIRRFRDQEPDPLLVIMRPSLEVFERAP